MAKLNGKREFLAFAGMPAVPRQRKPLIVPEHQNSGAYIDAEGLYEATDAAMLLGLPLLITGEPGTGKTQAGYWLSDQLGESGDPSHLGLLRTDVKSTTTGRELLYRFDEVARFRDSAPGGTRRPLIDYLEFEALGEAIIRAAGGRALLKVLGAKDPKEICQRAFGRSDTEMVAADLLPGDPTFASAEPTCRVVLIDELDKALRDTPNDLLSEIENMAFSIPELGLRVEAGHGKDAKQQLQRPIVIITSNSERDLPEPFLRRCAFFHIPFPSPARIQQIVALQVPGFGTPDKPSELAEAAATFMEDLRKTEGIQKKPGTAEMLAWCACLAGDVVGLKPHMKWKDVAAAETRRRLLHSLGTLVKTPGDLERARNLLELRLPV